jgi:hypothetical protein
MELVFPSTKPDLFLNTLASPKTHLIGVNNSNNSSSRRA